MHDRIRLTVLARAASGAWERSSSTDRRAVEQDALRRLNSETQESFRMLSATQITHSERGKAEDRERGGRGLRARPRCVRSPSRLCARCCAHHERPIHRFFQLHLDILLSSNIRPTHLRHVDHQRTQGRGLDAGESGQHVGRSQTKRGETRRHGGECRGSCGAYRSIRRHNRCIPQLLHPVRLRLLPARQGHESGFANQRLQICADEAVRH